MLDLLRCHGTRPRLSIRELVIEADRDFAHGVTLARPVRRAPKDLVTVHGVEGRRHPADVQRGEPFDFSRIPDRARRPFAEISPARRVAMVGELRRESGEVRRAVRSLRARGESKEHADAPIEPSGSAELSGAVVDALGGPVPFARLTLQSASGVTLGALNADVEGRFKARVPPGNVCVQARAPAFARATRCALAPDSGINLVLPPASELVGRVVAAGSAEGLGGVTVVVQPVSRADDWVSLNQETPRTVLSAMDGRFRVGELRGTGAYELLA